MGKRADIKVGFLCNNNCIFCVQAHKKEYGDRTNEEIIAELKDARKTCDEVVFTGGEVTIRKELIFWVKLAKELGFKKIQIQSNSRMLAYKEYCINLINAGATEFSPALHGYSAEIHDYLTGVKGSFKQTVQAIKNLKSLDQLVLINSVITKSNYRHLPKLAKLLVALNVDQFQFAFPHAVGNADKNFDKVVPSVSMVAPFIHKALQIGIDAGKMVMAEAMPYCLMKGYEDYVSEKYIPKGKIYDLNIVTEDWEKIRKESGKMKFSQCKKCKYDDICEGPWREYPEKRGNEEFKPVLN